MDYFIPWNLNVICSGDLEDTHILVSNSSDRSDRMECAYIRGEDSEAVIRKQCEPEPIAGRYLTLIKDQYAVNTNILILCEVVVMGYILPTGKNMLSDWCKTKKHSGLTWLSTYVQSYAHHLSSGIEISTSPLAWRHTRMSGNLIWLTLIVTHPWIWDLLYCLKEQYRNVHIYKNYIIG